MLIRRVQHALHSMKLVRANSRVFRPDGVVNYKPAVNNPAITDGSSVDSNTKAPVVLKETDLVEEFIRGSGPGGQSINKSMNRVRLTHIPTGMTVTCQEQRDLTSNRKIARTTLQNKLNYHYNGDESKIGRRIIRLKRRKQKAHSRAKAKYKAENNVENE